MPQIPKPYTFVGNTPAIANEVNANFDAILSVLNGNIDEANLKPFTVNQNLEPTADVAQINLLLSWIVNRLVNITGNADWKDDVAKNLREHRNDSPIDHPDGSVTDAKIGTRTIDDTVVPPGNILQLAAALSALANRIKAITGAATWRDDPATTLADAKAHMDSKGNVHNATPEDIGAARADTFNAHVAAYKEHDHAGTGGQPIPLAGLASAAKTTPGGVEPNRLAVTNANGKVGAALQADSATTAANAHKLGNYPPNTGKAGNTIPVRDQNGYIPGAIYGVRALSSDPPNPAIGEIWLRTDL